MSDDVGPRGYPESLPHLVESTVGPAVGPVLRHPWIVPVALLAIAAALLILSRRFFIRVLAYLVLLIAVLGGVGAAFLGGKLGDLRIGPIPAGMPVNAFANIDPAHQAELRGLLLDAFRLMRSIERLPPESEEARRKTDELGEKLLRVSKCPDLVMDRGHTFGAGLTNRERQDLMDLLITF